MTKKKTTEIIIKEFKEKHGDKYDYSKVKYIDSKTHVNIICKKHGEFKQFPKVHMRADIGCQKCAQIVKTETQKLKTFNNLLQLAKKIHGDKYDYSQVVYGDSKTKIKIYCKKCEKYFYMTYSNHTHKTRPQNCNLCNGNNSKKLTLKEFITRAIKVHGDKYDYSKIEKIINSEKKIKIYCKECQEYFFQKPCSHLKGAGCNIANKGVKKTQKEFIIQAIKVHEDKYDYSKVDYINCHIPVIIICTKHNKQFRQAPSSHLKNHNGCSKCSNNGFSNKQIQWLDFISILHNITIQHAINNKEYKIKDIGKVDGYCKENNTIYEFHGDFYHGNPMKYNILDKNAINSRTKQNYSKLYETTIKRDKKIKELGYNLVIMWENQWDKINNSIKLLQNKWRDYKNKPHKCEKCNISFKFKSQLEKHCKTELHKTGKKKTRSDKKEEFKCEICNLYTTNQQTNLKLHILNNHKTKEERKNEFPYYCELCDSGCMEEKLYKKHLETKKHKKKIDLLSK